MRRPTFVKIGVAAAAIVLLPWLFLKTARDTIAEPYEVAAAALSGWRLVVTDPGQPAISVLGLQPPPLLVPALFDQLFKRTMESMSSPGADILPIVLQREFQAGLHAVLSLDEMLQAARDAGLEETRLEPVCMGVKREPFVGRSRQLYFVLFEAPAVAAFRQQLGRLATARGSTDTVGSTAFDLVLPIAGSDTSFAHWFPMAVDRNMDCQAPLL